MRINFVADYDNYIDYPELTIKEFVDKYGLYYRIMYEITFDDAILSDSFNIKTTVMYQDSSHEYSEKEFSEDVFIDDFWCLMLETIDCTYGAIHCRHLANKGSHMSFAYIHKPFIFCDDETFIYDGEEYKIAHVTENEKPCELCDFELHCTKFIDTYLAMMCGAEFCNNGIYIKKTNG